MTGGNLDSLWPGWFQVVPMIAVFGLMPAVLVWVIYKKSNLPSHRKSLFVPGSILLPFSVTGMLPFLIAKAGLYHVDGRAASFQETARMFGDYSAYVWTATTGLIVWGVCLYFVRKGRRIQRPSK